MVDSSNLRLNKYLGEVKKCIKLHFGVHFTTIDEKPFHKKIYPQEQLDMKKLDGSGLFENRNRVGAKNNPETESHQPNHILG